MNINIIYICIFFLIIGLIFYTIKPIITGLITHPRIIVYPDPVYNVFWTGGYDSTFLVVYLLEFGNVQPVYLKGDAFVRKSKDKEIQTMDAIRKSIRSSYKLLPTIYVNNQLLDQDILDAEQEAKEFYDGKKLSTVLQYTYMAQYCKDNNFIGHVAAVNSGNYWQKLPVIDKGTTRCRNTTLRLFKNFRFPCIHLSKEEMRTLLNNDDILKKTWTCRRPVNDMPCGKCSLCKHRII
jgi:7-cyano-7-deazaguanine synthase in queuosine biosynthesis